MSTISDAHPGLRHSQPSRQPGSWRSAFLAGIPHLLMGLLISSGKIWGLSLSTPYRSLFLGAGLALMLLVAGMIIYAWRSHWPLWSASWYLYGAWIVMALLSLGVDRLKLNEPWRYTNFLNLAWIGLCIFGYNQVLRRDPLKGLLAVAFLFPFLGVLMQEFIPDVIEGGAAVLLGALAALTAAAVVRRAEFKFALLLVLGMNTFAGLFLAYLGEYQVKDLPAGIPTHIPQFSGFLGLLGLYLIIGLGIVSAPFLLQALWRFGRRTFSL